MQVIFYRRSKCDNSRTWFSWRVTDVLPAGITLLEWIPDQHEHPEWVNVRSEDNGIVTVEDEDGFLVQYTLRSIVGELPE